MAQRDSARQSGPFTLPSIATMTQGMSQDKSPRQNSGSAGGDMMRDSGMWSMQSPSKHSSTVSSATGFSTVSSSNGLQLHSILNSDDSPHRFSSASAASSVAPPARLSTQQSLPALNRAYTNDHNTRASIDANNTFFIDSRRSSIDSRVNVNLDGLALNHQSPYESNNASHTASQTSFASSIQQSRNSNPQAKSNGSTFATPARRPMTSGGQPPRRAPPIAANPRSGPNPNASTPTKGFAWAFPEDVEEEKADDSISPESSRQGSLAASSINNMDYGMRHGDPHHPSMQHKAITNLQGADGILGSGNYSRTPELRVSHKLAERKRRSEMKDLFDHLNRALPNSPGNKSSKWEVLSKAIEYIDGLKVAYTQGQKEIDRLRHELEQQRTTAEDNQQLASEITVMYQQLCRVDPNGHKIFGARTQQLVQQEQNSQHGPGHRAAGPAGYSAPMQGVEYPHYDRR